MTTATKSRAKSRAPSPAVTPAPVLAAPAPVAPMLRGAYDPPAAAEYLSISRSQLYIEMHAGRIKSVKIGRLRRILRTELDRFLAEASDGGYGGGDTA